MFHSTKELEAAVWRAFDAKRLPRFRPEPCPTARSEHARLLAIAAARRLRAVERLDEARPEDADYWKAVAPSAIGKARAWREEKSFSPLPE
ncbi:MAG TPA: hypothetical protein VEA44_16255 [Caulobacter sp.]|nr:hypothetical protein [Caulobacter sp.]